MCPTSTAAGITSQFALSFGPLPMSIICMGLPAMCYPQRNIVMIMCRTRYMRHKTRVEIKVELVSLLGSRPGNLVKLFVLFL